MSTYRRPGRTLVAGVAAIAVVALIGGVLYAMQAVRGTPPGSGGTPATLTSDVPTATPYPQGDHGATPGPLGQYVSKLYTTGAYPTDGTPIVVKSHFVVNDRVYVSLIVHGLPEGVHTISITWYVDGVAIDDPSGSLSISTVDGTLVVFSLNVPEPGAYMARVYIDRPATDTNDSPNDPYLAGTVAFVVELP